jgi:hypothetical protein
MRRYEAAFCRVDKAGTIKHGARRQSPSCCVSSCKALANARFFARLRGI